MLQQQVECFDSSTLKLPVFNQQNCLAESSQEHISLQYEANQNYKKSFRKLQKPSEKADGKSNENA
jgi:hypothetical protein